MATADIKEIDCDQIVTKASNIAKKADQMQRAIELAFKEINSMRENWFGTSYDNFIVNVVNITIPDLNKLFETTVSTIPHEIYAKAKSFAIANEYSLSASFSEQVITTLTDLITTKKGATFRFRDNEVKVNQKQINIHFQDAENFANDAKSEAQSLEDVWKSISGDTNIQELKSAFDKVIKIIKKLSKALDNYISTNSLRVNAIEGTAEAFEATGKVAANAIDSAEEAVQSAVNKMQADANQTWKNLTGKN